MANFPSIGIGQWLRAYRPSLLGAGLFVLVLSARHMGFVLVLVALTWIFWLPYSAYIAITQLERRKAEIARVLIWLAAAAIVIVAHSIRHHVVRQRADTIAAQISDYARQHGRYPSTLSAIGTSSVDMEEALGHAFYYPRENQAPNFFYGVTYEPFAVYAYDFERQAWEYIPD